MTTAIKDYMRLEAEAVWCPAPDAQRRDVVVKLGNATLIICDFQDRPLSHWSLPAVRRLNPGMMPACFAPVGAEDERLEFGENATEMTAAIARLSQALDRGKRGRLRRWAALFAGAALSVAAVFWVPEVLRSQALAVSSVEQRAETRDALLTPLTASAGAICTTSRGQQALAELATRLSPEQPLRLIVLPELDRATLPLPAQTIALDRRLFEDHDSPDYAAGAIMAALITMEDNPPFTQIIQTTSLPSLVGFLTSGTLNEAALDRYVATALTSPAPLPDDARWIAAMQAGALSMQGYVIERGRLGLAVSNTIIEAAASESDVQPVLGDQSWLSLQRLCE